MKIKKFLEKKHSELYYNEPSFFTCLLFRIKCFFNKKERRKIIDQHIDEFISSGVTDKERKLIYKDTIKCAIEYGASIKDYFVGDFYKKSFYERNRSVNGRFRTIYRRRLNNEEYKKYFRYKNYVYEGFHNYLGRSYLIVDDKCDYAKFSDFTSLYKELIVKPLDGDGGKGIYKTIVNTNEEAQKLYSECIKNGAVIEQVIVQNKEMKEFNPKSVNTIRLVTIISNTGKVNIVSAIFRMGNYGKNNNCVDNFSSGGIIAGIDIDTGVIKSCGYDKYSNEYVYHPVSNKQIVGFKIPNWDGYKNFVIELANVFPQIRYVGWDVALDENDNFVLIESNADAGVNIQEKYSNCGLKKKFLEVENS